MVGNVGLFLRMAQRQFHLLAQGDVHHGRDLEPALLRELQRRRGEQHVGHRTVAAHEADFTGRANTAADKFIEIARGHRPFVRFDNIDHVMAHQLVAFPAIDAREAVIHFDDAAVMVGHDDTDFGHVKNGCEKKQRVIAFALQRGIIGLGWLCHDIDQFDLSVRIRYRVDPETGDMKIARKCRQRLNRHRGMFARRHVERLNQVIRVFGIDHRVDVMADHLIRRAAEIFQRLAVGFDDDERRPGPFHDETGHRHEIKKGVVVDPPTHSGLPSYYGYYSPKMVKMLYISDE